MEKYTFTKTNLLKIGKGALWAVGIGAVGALITYLQGIQIDVGIFSGIAASGIAIFIKILEEFIRNR